MEWTMEKLTDLSTGYWGAAALNAAACLGVFDALGAGEATAGDIAKRAGCAEQSMDRLLHALAGIGVLDQHGDNFSISNSAREYLAPGGRACLVDALRFNANLYQLWGRLADSVRTGRPVVPLDEHLGGDSASTRRFVMGMHSRALGMAPALLPVLNTRGCRKLLDVGAGPGTFSRLLAQENRELRVVLFDLGPVLEVARQLGSDSALEERIEYMAGDYRKDQLPSGFDCVLYCGALHQEDEESACRLIRKIYKSLEEGGKMWIVDFLLDDDRSKPSFAAMFSITMMLTSSCGRVYTTGEAMEFCAEAGFKQLEYVQPGGSPYRVVKGRKV